MNKNALTLPSLSLCLGLALAGAACSPLPPAPHGATKLVSAAEVQQFKGSFSENLAIPLAGDEPAIEIIRPAVRDGKVITPVAIEVRFRAVAGKAIDPGSFKLYYGAFKLDVTDRLLKASKVSAQGFTMENVDIPAGSHRLIMKVSDDAGTTGFKEIKFTVGG